MSNIYTKNKPFGFTIIELLIVITIVGILVVITAVAYNGIVKNASFAALQQSTKSLTQQIEIFALENGTYPTSITTCPTPGKGQMCLKAPTGYEMSYRYAAKNGMLPNIPFNISVKGAWGWYDLSLMGDKDFIYEGRGEAVGANEFAQWTDLAPFIDKYGLKKYILELKIRSANTANQAVTAVYTQNGNGTRHVFSRDVALTMQDVMHKIEVTPTLRTSTVTESILAFYGTYGTGNIPIVSEVKFYLAP